MQAMCFLHMCITNNKVKVVNNASGKCLAASSPQTGMQSPIESKYKIPICRSGAERESALLLTDITRRLYNQQIYRLCNVRAGYVLYRALVEKLRRLAYDALVAESDTL